MTKDELKERFKRFFEANPPLEEIEELLNEILNLSVLDYKHDKGEDYRIVKIIYHAILCKMAKHWELASEENKKVSADIQKYI
ncbi:MAG: hypothetical protein J0G96_09850 [Flavobacteriia bacterium]|uniref:hypothetical protein n=1 Tax=uncultured Flavobacterium sp. TaxID=165435 RepID=UPI001ACB3DA1|nr:hypothetical protein [uncultured Flavobacterium sp.]MBN9294270.1 hypothetical protein [Flavobacteriia bacterium]